MLCADVVYDVTILRDLMATLAMLRSTHRERADSSGTFSVFLAQTKRAEDTYTFFKELVEEFDFQIDVIKSLGESEKTEENDSFRYPCDNRENVYLWHLS